jgi:hypothetical protein
MTVTGNGQTPTLALTVEIAEPSRFRKTLLRHRTGFLSSDGMEERVGALAQKGETSRITDHAAPFAAADFLDDAEPLQIGERGIDRGGRQACLLSELVGRQIGVLPKRIAAADAMADQPAGSRVVTVSTCLRDDGWRELAVRDQGPGLAAAVAADPFRPFATTKPQGLGLGLSICRTIVQAHAGTLAFDAPVRRGARVVLALPPP